MTDTTFDFERCNCHDSTAPNPDACPVHRRPVESPAPFVVGPMGWTCPRCGIVHAPFVHQCRCHLPMSAGTTIRLDR